MSKAVVDVWRLMTNINDSYHGENYDKLKEIISTLEPTEEFSQVNEFVITLLPITEEFVSEHYETMSMVAKLGDSTPALRVSIRVILLKSILDKVNGELD